MFDKFAFISEAPIVCYGCFGETDVAAQIRIRDITKPQRQGSGFAFEIISGDKRIPCWLSEFTLEKFHQRIHRATDAEPNAKVVKIRKC